MTDRANLNRAIDELEALVRAARRAIVFTGAGVSTDSGIPDYRSPSGIWARNRPIDYRAFLSSEDMRLEAWRRKFAIDDTTAGARPGITHHAISRLVRAGHVAAVVTQNIDGLHLQAATEDDEVIELHGNGTYAACLDCGLRHELSWARAEIETTGRAPRCTRCSGFVKSATISFGQPMPAAAMRRAEELAADADLFIALGSSLVVYPAATLPIIAKRAGAMLAIINREPTELDAAADLVIHAELTHVLQRFLT